MIHDIRGDHRFLIHVGSRKIACGSMLEYA